VNDAAKTAILRELVREWHIVQPDPYREPDIAGRWLVLDEVRNGTGAIKDRYADCVAVAMWPTDGLDIIGYELKASRADLKHELADLTKARETGGWMDEWWLVVWAERMLEELTVPEEWGILVRVTGKRDDEHDLKVLRKATRREREPGGKVARHRVTALLRAASRASFGAWYTAEAVRMAAHRAREEGERDGRFDAEQKVRDWLKPFREAMPLAHRWDTPPLKDLCEFATCALLREKEEDRG